MNARDEPPSASICILTFNRCPTLQRLLDELAGFDRERFEVIVVDNHSSDDTPQMLAGSFPWVRHLRTERNLGAAGRNVGLRAARADVVVTLDDDVSGLREPDVRTLVAMFADDPTLGAVNLRVTNEAGRTCNWVHHCRAEDFEHGTFATYEITEGAVALRRTAVDRAGYYAEDFFLSHEGPDLAFRLLEHGYAVLYSGRVAVRHGFEAASREPWRNYYYDTRNQFWLAARNFPASYAARYLCRGLASTLAYALRDGYPGVWAKAVVDGLAGLPRAWRQRRVLGARTMRQLREIDALRPGIGYLVRRRLLTRDGLLFN